MSEQLDFKDLAQQAQQGDRGALDRLAGLAAKRLRVYVYRMTLRDDLTDEIVQETMLEMVKILGKLKHTDRFLPWLYGIAINKLRHHYRTEDTLKRATASVAREDETLDDREEGLERMLSDELRQIVTSAMQALKTRHRAVLIMRCYDSMSYAEIAESMGCTEFGSRMLFLRAKKALQKQLAHSGLGKGALLAALVLFGKMTAPTEAAVAGVAITAGTVDVGLAAGVAGAMTSKAALVSMLAAGAVTAGAVIGPQMIRQPMAVEAGPVVSSVQAVPVPQIADGAQKHWYFYPEGVEGGLLLRAQAESYGAYPEWVILQNARGNYHVREGVVEIVNYRIWARDLSVLRLPTDSPDLQSFLSQVEGVHHQIPSIGLVRGTGVLVAMPMGADQQVRMPKVSRNPTVPEEDYFRADWPSSLTQVDSRDGMHKRGWTYFKVEGQIQGQLIVGQGRIPFVSKNLVRQSPWLDIRVGDLQVVDTTDGAWVADRSSGKKWGYRSGHFFAGMARPWVGLHTLDVIRRDAAAEQIHFTTSLGPQDGKARVELTVGQLKAIYTVDLERDLLDRVEWVQDGHALCTLVLTYVDEIDKPGLELEMPRSRSYATSGASRDDIFWLVHLAQGGLPE